METYGQDDIYENLDFDGTVRSRVCALHESSLIFCVQPDSRVDNEDKGRNNSDDEEDGDDSGNEQKEKKTSAAVTKAQKKAARAAAKAASSAAQMPAPAPAVGPAADSPQVDSYPEENATKHVVIVIARSYSGFWAGS